MQYEGGFQKPQKWHSSDGGLSHTVTGGGAPSSTPSTNLLTGHRRPPAWAPAALGPEGEGGDGAALGHHETPGSLELPLGGLPGEKPPSVLPNQTICEHRGSVSGKQGPEPHATGAVSTWSPAQKSQRGAPGDLAFSSPQ